MASSGTVCFNHGQESGPWGTKIQRLAQIAQSHGFAVESVDYTGMADPDRRVAKLLAASTGFFHPMVLVGSSMGGYVATVASATLRPAGLFLMAPAFYLPGFTDQDPAPHADLVAVVHGWRDEVVPPEHSLRFARRFSAQLHLLDGEHALISQLPWIAWFFEHFLAQLRALSEKE